MTGKAHIFFCLFILLTSSSLTAQENVIKELEGNAAIYKQALDSIFSALEVAKLTRIREALPGFLPVLKEGSQLVNHTAFVLSYNEEHEQADWVTHILTKDILYGSVSRTNDFRPDPLVLSGTADSVDYWESGYDRGHLAPSADFRWSAAALSESYYYSNMSPQVPELNRDTWSKLENQVREWALDAGELCIVTGPVLRPGLPKIPQGSMRVSIPELYYKIIYDYGSSPTKAIAFVFPNKPQSYKIVNHVVAVDSIEKLTGIDFFPALADSAEERIEKKSDLAAWPIRQFAVNGDVMPIDYAKGQVSTSQAKYFYGEEATICGKVVATKFNQNGKTDPTYINLDKKFPEQIFTLVIFGKDRVNFGYAPEKYLYDKRICVTGKVLEYKGIAEIIANNEKQILVIE